MTEQVTTPAAEPAPQAAPEFTPEPATEITAPADTPERVSLRDAGRILNAARLAKMKPQEQPQAGANPSDQARGQAATPAQEPPPEGAAAPPQEAPGEQAPEANPAPNEPPIEPPRSWTTEEKEAFKALPREHQSRIAERERARDAEINRRNNEAADQRKAADAEREAMVKARNEYEAALPTLLATLQNATEFADIKTTADVERLVKEDWPRYVQWDFHQKKIAAVQQELQQAKDRQEKEVREDWTHFSKREDELFVEKAPEMKDQAKAAKVREGAVALLKERGFSEEELGKLWSSKFLRDHRMQLILLDAVRLRDAQQAALAVAKKPLPPVQRPGVAQPNKDRDAVVKDLEDRLNKTGSLKDAAALMAARRKSA